MTVVHAETGEIVAPLSEDEARDLTDQIADDLTDVWELIKRAYVGRAWDALYYSSWDEYCREEFSASRLRLPSETRKEVVNSLRDAGLSIRAISSATGSSVGTVHSDLSPPDDDGSGVQNRTPDDDVSPLADTRHRNLVSGKAFDRSEVEPNFKDSPPKPAPKVKGTDGKTYSRTTEQTTKTTETQGPIGQEAVDLATERTARSDAAYRENLSKARVKVNDLTKLDPERCARVLPLEDRDLELSFIARVRSWLDTYEGQLSTSTLRSVSQ